MLNADFQKLCVDGLITLYELNAEKLGAGILRFHSHMQSGNIIFRGKTFEPMSMQVSGLEMRTDGKASAPNMTMANNINGIQGAVSAYCLQFNDFAGAELKVITTLAKYLDAVNFDDGNPHASDECKEQIWYVEQKTSENAQQVSFELSNPVDFEGLKIPVRQISNYCHWAVCEKYRGEECGYTGSARFTYDNQPTDNPELDKCCGTLKACQLRFGRNKPLSFGGYPASSLLGN